LAIKKKPAKSQSNNQPQSTFINYNLDAAEKKACKEWSLTLEDFDDAFSKLAEAGYKVTIRYDERGECFAAWLIPASDHPRNAGAILAGRGSTSLKAVKQALYIHHVIFDEDWSSWSHGLSREELDD
jgi:hypothetical protein